MLHIKNNIFENKSGEKMKIVFNCLTLEKGGAERVIATLCNEFVSNNDVTIVKMKAGKIMYDLNDKIKVHTIDRRIYNKKSKIKKFFSRLSIRRFVILRKVIIEENPDVIISFLPEPSLRLMTLKLFSKKIRSIKTIISIRNDPMTEYKNRILRYIVKRLYKNVDGLVLQTTEAMNFFEDMIPKEKMVVIPNPINETFLVKKSYAGIRKKEIVTVGRLEKQKNHRLLIDSFIKFRQTHGNYVLKIYGDGTLREQLESYIKLKNEENNIFLMGITNDVKNQIYSSACFVLSSNYEGMPNALMEAMALGLPCISTNCPCGGPKELIKDGVNGFLVEVNNMNQMAELMSYVVENKDNSEIVCVNSHNDMKQFSSKKITKRWNDYIGSIIGGN